MDVLATARLAARPYEVFENITSEGDWQRCQHGKRIVEVRAHWSDDAPFTVTTGLVNHTQVFRRWVHADGSPGADYEHNTVSRCPKCHGLNTLRTLQEAYGDWTTCSECDYAHWYDIGD